jgi:hypothetical protein
MCGFPFDSSERGRKMAVMSRCWDSFEELDRDYVRARESLRRKAGHPTRDEIAKSLGISRFTLKRLQERLFFGQGGSCDFCGERLPDWATKRKRFCSDACRAKYWRLDRP